MKSGCWFILESHYVFSIYFFLLESCVFLKASFLTLTIITVKFITFTLIVNSALRDRWQSLRVAFMKHCFHTLSFRFTTVFMYILFKWANKRLMADLNRKNDSAQHVFKSCQCPLRKNILELRLKRIHSQLFVEKHDWTRKADRKTNCLFQK